MKILTLLLVLLLTPVRAWADERWYTFSIGGTPVGWVHERTDGRTTRTILTARLTRLGKSVDMRFDTVITEDVKGALVTLEYEALLAKQPMKLQARVDGNQVRILTPPHERVIEAGPDPLLGPMAIARLTAERLRAAGDRIEYRIFSPELQGVAKVRRQLITASEQTPCGREARRIEETLEGLPTPRTVWVDANALMIGDSLAGPFGAMSTCRSSKDAAMSAEGTLPADIYEKTLARSNVRFGDPFALDRVVIRVKGRDPSQPLPDFTAHNQRVTATGVVEITRVPRATTGAAGAPAPEFVGSNTYVESDHQEIVRIAKSLATADGYATALALTKWTAENLTMDAGIVMARASELVRDRRGTCMGFATLLAALARAAGLPSRVVMGYVYYGGIWGGHAWTEMLVDGAWLPFDAAVYAPGVASAARLSVGSSSLADGGGSLVGPLSGLFGQVDIEIVEYEQNGRVKHVPSGARPYHLDAGAYENPGLGLRIPANGWQIARADSTWPSSLVVAFQKGDTSIELHHKPRYPDGAVKHDADAMFTTIEGGTLWVWAARGPDAGSALRAFLNRVERVH